MSLLTFLIKSSCCLALFLLFYKLFLERERMHVFKRFYLLTALLLSFVIPSIIFTEYVEVAPVAEKTVDSERAVQGSNATRNRSNDKVESFSAMFQASELPAQDRFNDWPVLLWSIYFVGVMVFVLKFLRNLWGIRKNIRNNPRTKIGRTIHVLLRDAIVPHTFFNYIFLNQDNYEHKKIPSEVILHEQTHAGQIHSFDILLVELLQIVFWFNPLLYLWKAYIKLNHEFLADQAVIDRGASTPGYQEILLTFAASASGQDNQSSLVNAINYSSFSSIKKRFTVMRTHTSKKSVIWRTILLLPILALLLYGFSSTVQITRPTETVIDTQEGANHKQIREYNVLAKKYNKMLVKKGHIRIEKQEVDRLETLFDLMTKPQRAEAEPYPDFPQPPVPPTPPSPPNQSEQDMVQHAEQMAAQLEYQKHLMEAREEKIRSQKVWSGKQVAQMRTQIQETVKQVEEMASQETLTQLEQLDLEKLMEEVQHQITEVMENTDLVAKREEALEDIIENQEIYDELRYINLEQIQSIIGSKRNIGLRNSGMQLYLNATPSAPIPPKPQSTLPQLEELKGENVLIILNGKEVDYEEAVEVARKNTFSKVHIKRKSGKRTVIRLKTQ